MNTPTPRTDAESFYPHDSKEKAVDSFFAQQLERELTAVTAERDQLRIDRHYNRKCINRLASATGTLGEKSEKIVEVALSTIDQLRAAIAEMPTCRCDRNTDQQCELSAKISALRDEVERTDAIYQRACEVEHELRAEVERLTKQAVFDADHIHTLNAAFATRAELTDAIARAERAEVAETVALANWNGALERAMKAEADLAALEQCHDDNCRAVVKIAEELAAERAMKEDAK
jgi:hypothetical protein